MLQMLVYGVMYKKGHMRKNWQMRLFILNGDVCSYYTLGEHEAKGSFNLSQITEIDTKVRACQGTNTTPSP
eukprot:SAG22_NODE_85_length_21510_cov_6.472187_17_plen_71_part_00